MRVSKFRPIFAIGPDEIGIAETTDGGVTIGIPAGPQIAAGKTAKHGRTARVRAFALQGVENFFDRVRHAGCLYAVLR
jgi:hypothetical protein